MVLGAWHGFIRGPGVSEEDFHSRKDNAEFQPFLVCRYVLFVSPMFAIIFKKLCNLAFIAAPLQLVAAQDNISNLVSEHFLCAETMIL